MKAALVHAGKIGKMHVTIVKHTLWRVFFKPKPFFRSRYFRRGEVSIVNTFEEKMARYMRAENTYFTHSGADSNQQIVQFMLHCNPKHQMYVDNLTHPTLVYAAKGAGKSKIYRFDHNCTQGLADLISKYDQGLVCIDTVYSLLGDIAPIGDILDICKKTGSILLADESHAIGIFGPNGSGIIPMLGLQNAVPIRTASLAKSFGALGGVIAFNPEYAYIRELIPTYATLSVYSQAPQDSRAMRFLGALDIYESEDGEKLRKELWEKSAYFRKGCIERGYDGPNLHDDGPIIPFITGDITETKSIYQRFVVNKIYPSAGFYPVVPMNRSMIRWTLCNKLSWQEIDVTLNFLEDKRQDLKPWTWPWTMDRKK